MRVRARRYHHCENPWDTAPPWAIELAVQLGLITEMMERVIMPTLDQILADTSEETTLIASVSTLLDGLRLQLADVLAGVLPPDVQAKVDAIFAATESNKAALAKALESPGA